MEKVVISQEVFDKLRENSHSTEASALDNHIFNIINHFKDQKVFYGLDFVSYQPDNIKSRYATFGIILDSFDLTISENRRDCIIIIEPDWEDFEQGCKDFVNKYLPAGTTPIYFAVNKNITELDEFHYWVRKISDIYPGIQSYFTYRTLKKSRSELKVLLRMKQELLDLNLPTCDISAAREALQQVFEKSNVRTLQRWQDIEAENFSKLNDSHVLYTTSEQDRFVALITAYLSYKYGCSFHLQNSDMEQTLALYSTLMLSDQHSLAEDRIRYITELPDVLMSINEGTQFLVLLDNRKRIDNLTITAIDVNDLDYGGLQRFDISARDISLIYLENEFDFSVGNYYEEHSRLLDIYRKFEAKIKLNGNTINVTNSFFFELNGIKMLGYIEKINLRIPSQVIPLASEYVSAPKEIQYNDLSTLYPVSILPNYAPELGRILSIIKRKTGFTPTKLNIYKHRHALGILILRMAHNGPYTLNLSTGFDFVTVGLWYDTAVKFRSTLTKGISNYIDLTAFRADQDYLSAFGGPHPLLNPVFRTNEKHFKE